MFSRLKWEFIVPAVICVFAHCGLVIFRAGLWPLRFFVHVVDGVLRCGKPTDEEFNNPIRPVIKPFYD